MEKAPKIALMLPCLNEELTLAKVIREFRAELPSLDIYVFDNGSTDRSADIALEEGAQLVPVPRRGKGHVVRKMFESIDADYYIMVDSDDTYDAKGVWDLLKPVLNGECDMSVGSRVSDSKKAYRRFHRFGNSLIQNLINAIFKSKLTDILSGYRVMSKHFVKNIPFLRDGFEVETELTVYSLICGFHLKEVPLPYGERPDNSFSKLRTFSDGYKVLLTIVWLARDLRPLLFFGLSSFFTFVGAVVPTLILSPQALFAQLALTMLSISLLMTGLILNTLNVKFAELHVLGRRHNPKTLTTKASQPITLMHPAV